MNEAARRRATNLKDAQVHAPAKPKPPQKFLFHQQVDIIEIRNKGMVFAVGKGIVVGIEWAGDHREFRVDEWLYYIKTPGRQEWLRILESKLNATANQPA